MFKTTTTRSRTAGALVAAALCTASLFASPAAFAKDVQVSYADLDLSTAAGQKKLQARLQKAARSACGAGAITTGSIVPSAGDRACYDQATAKAKQQMTAVLARANQEERLGG
jgi:UrcA family protein